jgi:hypothetical protein
MFGRLAQARPSSVGLSFYELRTKRPAEHFHFQNNQYEKIGSKFKVDVEHTWLQQLL